MSKNLREKLAAELLNKPVRTLQQWRWRGVGPKYLRIGRSILYREQDLLDFLRSCEVETNPIGSKAA